MSATDYAPPALIAAAQNGSRAAAEELLARNVGLIRAVAGRFGKRASDSGIDEDDLFQLASIGLWKAIREFDASLNYRFSTYAVPKMIGEIRRYLRDDGPIKVSRSLKETAARTAAARESLSHRLGREPTLSELSAATGIDPEEIVQLPQIVHDDGETDLLASLADPEPAEDRLLERLALEHALAHLPPRTRRILELRYIRGLSQQKIAPLFGVSQVQISRIERSGLSELKTYFA